VSIARTVEAPQQGFAEFLYVMGSSLGRLAKIRTITSTQMTFLESSGISNALRNSRSDPQAVQRFSYWLSGQLNEYRGKNIYVTIDPDHPIIICGRHDNKLALNILKDEQIGGEREKGEELLDQKFGNLPRLKPFKPHITIGSIGIQGLSAVEVEHPELLIPREVEIPERVALNGLTVFLDGKGLVH
jgi:hypothetical protein